MKLSERTGGLGLPRGVPFHPGGARGSLCVAAPCMGDGIPEVERCRNETPSASNRPFGPLFPGRQAGPIVAGRSKRRSPREGQTQLPGTHTVPESGAKGPDHGSHPEAILPPGGKRKPPGQETLSPCSKRPDPGEEGSEYPSDAPPTETAAQRKKPKRGPPEQAPKPKGGSETPRPGPTRGGVGPPKGFPQFKVPANPKGFDPAYQK
ncbi:basic salivary proline-rich protein 2-like, partial [Penaeus monodon]|uniref:basic salivary proline-rich protein 2-like n=1 Tax=Penaeus monodon TaxID=6687 RepID=UPI0018A780B6